MDARSNVSLRSGAAMPIMGLGTWQLTRDTADIIEKALALGYRMIDTSGDYGTQPGIAQGLRQSGADRMRYFIVTKVEEDEDAYDAAYRNVRELGLEYADLILIHRPPASGAGEDLWRGLMQARDEGVARDIGVSNYPAELIDDLIAKTGETPAVHQIEWSPFGYSERMRAYATEKEIVLQAYSPLTRGRRLSDDVLDEVAAEYAKTPAQVMLRWHVERGTVPIPKANNEKHLAENIDIFDFELAEGDLEKLDALNERYSSLGALPYA